MSEAFGQPSEEYARRLEEGSVLAATKAFMAIDAAKPDTQATVLFGQSQEATIGRNSRLLLKDGSIGWDGYEEQDVVTMLIHGLLAIIPGTTSSRPTMNSGFVVPASFLAPVLP